MLAGAMLLLTNKLTDVNRYKIALIIIQVEHEKSAT